MKIAPAILVLALASVLSGCTPAVSIRPLYTEADLKKPIAEPRIEGEWIRFDQENGEGEEWKIAPGPGDTYDIETRPAKLDPQKGEESSRYSVRLVAMGGKLFFDGQFSERSEGRVKTGQQDNVGLAPAHIIGGIWVHPDYLRTSFLSSSWTEEHSPASFYEAVGHGEQDDTAIITASTQEVRDLLVRAQDNDAATFSLYLCRAGVDCGMRWAEDELSRLPKDEETRDGLLEQLAQFFLARGDYDRAVEMRRHRLEVKPSNASSHEDLGRTLLFKRDFRNARTEFGIAESLEQDQFKSNPWNDMSVIQDIYNHAMSEDADDILWSYFLDGDYSSAVAAFDYYKRPHESRSANSILLSYFSLRRLGKRLEAASFLKEQSGQFKGPADDQLLLLDAQGRLIEGTGSSIELKGDALQRSYFYKALGWIENGNTENARQYLENALGVADALKDGLPALAAKVELDRLPRHPRSDSHFRRPPIEAPGANPDGESRVFMVMTLW